MSSNRLAKTPPLTRRGVFETVATFAVVVALLYLGASIVVPVVLAVLLAFALSSLVDVLSRRLHLPDAAAVMLAVLATILALGVFAYVAGTQLIQIAAELPAYQTTIATKLRDLQGQLGGGFLEGLTGAIGTLTEQLSGGGVLSSRQPGDPLPVMIADEAPDPFGLVTALLGTLVGPLATAAIVLIFLIFLLLGRGELQERFIRLVSRRGYSTTNLAMRDASQRVGRYLLLQLFMNVIYGTIFGLGLLLIGVPGAILWGLMIMLFRYIPFIGGLLVAFIPFLLAFAVDSGWGMLTATFALFLVLDLTMANVVEPRVYGASTGVSPIAILLSAMFWGTLWGPIGLILATPMTVCLVVIGRHIPQLQVLETLLGSEPVLEPPERLYQRMLKGDTEEAIEVAEEIVGASGLETFHNTVLLSALRMASSELSDTPEALAQRRVLTASIDGVIAELGQAEPATGDTVVLIGGRTEIDECGARVVAQRLAKQGVPSRILPPMAVRQESIGQLDIQGAAVVCLFYFASDIKAQTRYVSRRLKRMKPDLNIVVCILAEERSADTAETLRVDGLTRDFDTTLEEIDRHLDILTAKTKLAGHQPFEGGGRGDDALGKALQAVSETMRVPLATINLLSDERHREESDAYKLTELIAQRAAPLVIHAGKGGDDLGDNPYLQSNGVDFYAGVPLTLANGDTVGTLVLIDYKERDFGDAEVAKLQELAADLVVRFGNAPRSRSLAA